MKRLTMLLAAAGLLASCAMPLTKTEQTGKVTFRTDSTFALGTKSASGRTIFPTVPAATYTIALTGAANLTFANVSTLSDSYDIPLGTYDLVVSLIATSGGATIGVSDVQSITVLPSTNTFTVDVNPTQSGNGYLDVSYVWPAVGGDGVSAVADAAAVTLVSIPSAASVDISGSTVVNINSQQASVGISLPSGNYLVRLELSKQVGGVVLTQPSVSEVVQIYDDMTSSKAYSLTVSDLNGAPAAPGSVTGSIDDDGASVIEWTMGSGTQDGFHVYRDNVFINTVAAAARLAVDGNLPTASTTLFEVAAYNAWGESSRRSVTVNAATVPHTTDYGLFIGASETSSAKDTTMKLFWDNPDADVVSIYRATSLAGPYELVDSVTTSSYVDTDDTGLIPGTTYYYSLGSGAPLSEPGFLFGLTSSSVQTRPYNVMPYMENHLDPVDGVSSGTTMTYYPGSTRGLPVLGVPYLLSDSSQLPALGGGDYWNAIEFPVKALLSGGYTYWLWGETHINDMFIEIGAFDSTGTLVKTYKTPPPPAPNADRFVADFSLMGEDLYVVRQASTVNIPWSVFDASPSAVTVSIDFAIPSFPATTINATAAEIDTSQTIDFAVTAPSGLTFVKWQVDGLDEYPTTGPFYVDPDGTLTIYPNDFDAGNRAGTHEATVYVTDGVNVYSETVNFVILALNQAS